MNTDEYLYFLDRAFDGIIAAVTELGDDLANTSPPWGDANSPWAIGYHCTEVARYWIGHLIGGRTSTRDRMSEFNAQGAGAQLIHIVDELRADLREDLSGFDATAPLANTPPVEYEGPSRDLTPSGVLLHVLEELAQHHGQVQMSRDILLGAAQVVP
ncbi:hypothetical protein BH11ACT6_BH11ACT6_07320 [soil metagenome]